MGCEACEEMFDEGFAPYRWGRATVGIIACREHAKEIIEALNEAQDIDNGEDV